MSTGGRSLKRYLAWTIISLLLLVMAVLTVVSTFLATESGSRIITQWGLARAAEMEGIEVNVQEITGNLLQGLRLREVDFSTAAVDVRAQTVLADWDPLSLLAGNFQLARLQLEEISVQLKDSGGEAEVGAQSPLANFAFAALPVGISIAEFSVSDLRINSGPQQIDIGSIGSRISLQETELELAGLNLDSDLLVLSGDIVLELAAGLPVDASLRWSYPQPLPMQLQEASGLLELAGSVENLRLSHELVSPASLRSTGLLEIFSEQGLRLDLQHQSDHIVLPEQLLSVVVEQFQLHTRGTLSALEITLATDVQMPDAPPLALNAEGVLTDEKLTLASEIDSPGGTLSSNVILDYSAGVEVSGSFDLNESAPMAVLSTFSPGSAPADFPLADVQVAGDFNFLAIGEQIGLQVSLDDASARLDGYEVTATGSISLDEAVWQFTNLSLVSSANQLLVNGRLDENIDLDWAIEAPALEQFVPGVQASATGAGTLRGTLSAPLVDADFSVAGVSAEFGTLDSLQLTVEGDPEFYSGTLRVGGARMVDVQNPLLIDQAALEFEGTAEEHMLSLTLAGEYADSQLAADLSLNGGFADLANGDWQGQLTRGEISSAAGDWRMLTASAIGISNQQLTVNDSCWSYASMQVCFGLAPGADDSHVAQASVSRFPLQEFDAPREITPLITLPWFPRLPAGVALEGEANATMRAEFGESRQAALSLTATADDAVLILRAGPEDQYGAERSAGEIQEQSYTWRQLSLSGDYQDGEWRFDARAQLDTDNLQDSDLQLTGELDAQLTLDAGGNLLGSSSAEFSDLGWVSAFAPELRDVSGLLESQLDIAGTLAAPQITGLIRLNDASFFLERTGVTYSDIDLSLNGTSFSSATLEGSMTTEGGYIAFSGAVLGLNSRDWHVEAELNGEAFQIASTEDLTLQISPDLNLDANAQRIDLRGDLHLPVFNIELRELPESAVDISRDVVIRNYPEDRPDLARSYTSNQTAVFDLPMSADLKLSLGDQVSFTGFGLQAALQGELEVQQQVTGASFTYGELAITEGYYRIYGQELNLQDGKLLFLGNYANPALDIRAVREVQNQTVGVQINGTLNNMRSQLFSSPVLPEGDILAVLVTGRPASELQSSDGDAMLGAIAGLGIEQSQGLTESLGDRLGLDTVAITNTGNIDSSELTIGKYLTPQVFIRYGVGLFDRFSKVAVDYMINDRLTLQAESGEYQSIDFTYRVER